MDFPICLETPTRTLHFVIDAAHSFGSGEHESTASCLSLLVGLAAGRNASLMLDVGCGSGILSVAAAKLGVASIVSFDINLDACRTARQNFRRNLVERQISLFNGTIEAIHKQRFGLIVANIQGDIVLEMHRVLATLLAENGMIIVAGIAWDWLYDVKTAFCDQGLECVESRQLEEFSTFVFHKPEDHERTRTI